jgi:hypothetical protein
MGIGSTGSATRGKPTVVGAAAGGALSTTAVPMPATTRPNVTAINPTRDPAAKLHPRFADMVIIRRRRRLR